MRGARFGVFVLAILAMSSLGAAQEVEIPSQGDWTDHGIVLNPGPTGSWDVRLTGAISPCTVVKKNDLYYLYYIGADGDRTHPSNPDGGPRHRALGVATSSDGINFTKYAGNPVITHLPHWPSGMNHEEEGVFSAGAALDTNGDVVMYYGGLTANSLTGVYSDGRVATSSGGFNFTNHQEVIDHAGSGVWGRGDEIFPVGAFRRPSDGNWFVYYIAKGYSGVMWDLGLASGPAKDNLTSTQAVLESGSYIIGGCDPIWLSSEKLALFVVRDFDSTVIEVRTASVDSPGDLGTLETTYDFGDNLGHCTVFLDTEAVGGGSAGKWFMYYLSDDGAIRIKTANAVPEPATLVLLVLGGAGTLLRRRGERQP